MSTTIYWLQCGGCGGDTVSLMNAQTPNILDLINDLKIEVLWHPSLSNDSHCKHTGVVNRIVDDQQPLDILCIEGAVILGPSGTGMYNCHAGQPKKDLIAKLADKAKYVIAVGTCASFGGVGSDGEIEACGVQFLKWEKGGFLGADFVAKSGYPVINLPGCPCHCDVITSTLAMIAQGNEIELSELNTPKDWYNLLVHQGCTRNEYHEYRVEEHGFGEKGCLFFHMGCHGPLVHGPCNKVLWNGRSSKTRVGVPCFGCTRPDFPQDYAFFQTRNIEGIPTELPDGVDRAHYLAYKGMAAAAAPQRLKQRETRV